jgi:NADPH-dependent ferric siderophore reductase
LEAYLVARPRTTFVVQRTERLTEHLIRVVLGGPGFSAFRPSEFTDSYVKFIFPRDGDEVRRAYTVRSVDPVTGEIAVDFVYHGEEGIAGPWAASARPGDTIDVQGPGGAYAPRADADWHMFAGDEAALPAIAVALATLSADAVGQAFIEIGGSGDRVPLDKPDGVELTWLPRGDAKPGTVLAESVRAAAWWDGQVQVFIHGEGQAVMQDLRGYVRKDRGVPADWASISGYWRYGDTDETFRQWKADLARAEAAELPS